MADERSRVLTLVFTDLADSTALKTARGDVAVGDLISRHRERVTQLAEECAGRVIDWAGDGCFLTFETSSAAVMFALRLQQAHAEETDFPEVRIGVHMGEVTEKPGPGDAPRVEGLAVDVAARISGLAHPGQVLMSSAVYNSARQRIGVDAIGQPLVWQLHGSYSLKGFDDPMDICEAGLEGISSLLAPKASDKAKLIKRAKRSGMSITGSRPPRQGMPIWSMGLIVLLLLVIGLFVGREFGFAPKDPRTLDEIGPITSLAVLPFDNLSEEAGQEYFVDGMTDALSAELAKIKALKVISRTSAMLFKNSDLPLPEIAAALGVDALIEGSVFRAGNEVVITAQLIHGETDAHLWADTYEGTLDNIVALQKEVVRAIAAEIQVALTPAEEVALTTARTVNPDAHDLYLQGLFYWQQHTKASGLRAVDLFEQSIEIDPKYALAYTGLAYAHADLVSVFLAPHDAMPQARAAALEALHLDDDLAEAHAVLGYVSLQYDWNWKEAERQLRRAIELNPNLATAQSGLAQFHASTGDVDAALHDVELALQLEPYSPIVADNAATVYYMTRQFDELIRHTKTYLDMYPNNPNFHMWLGGAYAQISDYQRAIESSERAVELEANPLTVAFLGTSYGVAGEVEKAREVLAQLDRQREAGLYVCSYEVASVHVALGEFDEAFAWLEKAFTERANCMPWTDTDPRWDPIRDDPRFDALLKRIGLGEYLGIVDAEPIDEPISNRPAAPSGDSVEQ